MKIPLRTILAGVAVSAVTLFVADLGVHRMVRNSVPRQVMRTINLAPAHFDVLALGNSLMAAGFDPAIVEEDSTHVGRPLVAVNGSLGATGVIEHLLLARLAFKHHAVGTVVYGFFDQQMSSDLPHKNSDLIGNPSMLYYQEPEVTLQYAPFNFLDKLSFRVDGCCALLTERSTLWAKVEKMRRRLEEIGMSRKETNALGRKADFDLLEASDSDLFAQKCREVIQSHALLSAPVQALLQQARRHGAKVIVVEMPMHPLHLRRFYDQPIWTEFRAKTQEAVEREGAVYLDASHWVPDELLFDDHLHLSKAGSVKFSRMLGEYLRHRQTGVPQSGMQRISRR